jgi:hypothetical protein
LGVQASAQTPEQFYAGKTIDFVIGYPPGGSNDTFGRLLARHLGKHIPGKPAIVPKNQLPGGEQRHPPGFPGYPRSVGTSARTGFPKKGGGKPLGSHYPSAAQAASARAARGLP